MFDLKLSKDICSPLLTLLKYELLAWNYNEKMRDIKLTPTIEVNSILEKASTLVHSYPRLILKLFEKVGTN